MTKRNVTTAKAHGQLIHFPGGDLARSRFDKLSTTELLTLARETFALSEDDARARHFTELYPLLWSTNTFVQARQRLAMFEGDNPAEQRRAVLSLRWGFDCALRNSEEGMLDSFVEAALRPALIKSLAIVDVRAPVTTAGRRR